MNTEQESTASDGKSHSKVLEARVILEGLIGWGPRGNWLKVFSLLFLAFAMLRVNSLMYLRSLSAREQFTAKDIEFVIDTLTSDEAGAESLVALLLDKEESEKIFASEILVRRLQEPDVFSEVSARFFLYVMLKKALKDRGLDSPDLVDYLANMMARFIEKDQWRKAPGTQNTIVDYEYELRAAIEAATHYQRYDLHVYGGDRSLFMTGLHASYIRNRKRRKGAPGVRFYEQMGIGHYRAAMNHPLAREFDLDHTFDLLSDQFQLLRSCLNHLTSEYFA